MRCHQIRTMLVSTAQVSYSAAERVICPTVPSQADAI